MALSTTLTALTREKFLPILVDNIYNSNVLTFKLLKNAEKLSGGAKIVVPVEYAQNSTHSGWLAYDGAAAQATRANVNIDNIAQKATFDWATAYNSILISGDEPFMNSGAEQVVSILKAKMSNAERSIRDTIGTSMFDATVPATGELYSLNGTGNAGVAITSAVDDGDETDDHSSSVVGYLARDNASGQTGGFTTNFLGESAQAFLPPCHVENAVIGMARAYGGIDTVSGTTVQNRWWDGKVNTFEYAIGKVAGASDGAVLTTSNDTAGVSFANFTSTLNGVAMGVQAMTHMYGKCSIDNDQPDLIVCSQNVYDAYESSLQGNKRFEGDAELADAGFQSLRFKGASVVVDSHCPAGHMYFLNTKYLDFKVHAKRNFALDSFKEMEAYDGLQARIFWMGQLVCSNPAMQGVLVGGPL